jgi:hypothetical protein
LKDYVKIFHIKIAQVNIANTFKIDLKNM